MTMRLVFSVVGFTAACLGGYAIQNGSWAQTTKDSAPSSLPSLTGAVSRIGSALTGSSSAPASVTGSRGAKFVAIDKAPPQQDAESTLVRDKILEKLGFHTGPDPREGTTLDALKMRQKSEQGQLSIQEIGIDGVMSDIAAQIDQVAAGR